MTSTIQGNLREFEYLAVIPFYNKDTMFSVRCEPVRKKQLITETDYSLYFGVKYQLCFAEEGNKSKYHG